MGSLSKKNKKMRDTMFCIINYIGNKTSFNILANFALDKLYKCLQRSFIIDKDSAKGTAKSQVST